MTRLSPGESQLVPQGDQWLSLLIYTGFVYSWELTREARRRAGLTQQQLARRLGISQASLARLESPRANPTVATLDRVLAATGQRLELGLTPAMPSVDIGLLREALRLSPAERIATAERLLDDAERIAAARVRSRRPRRSWGA